MGFEVSLLGVRGSYSSSKSRPSLYGSHTTCALVQAGSQMIMLDAGSGATNADTDRVRGWSGEDFSLLLTHYHHDHVIGFPFMARPAAGTLQVFGPRLGEVGPEEALRRMVAPPLFPVELEMLGPIAFQPFDPSSHSFTLGRGEDALRVRSQAVNHPGGAVGYRIEHKGHVFCFIPDIELPNDPSVAFDPELIAFITGADALVIDAAYAVEDFARYIGWGHSHWGQALELAEQAGVRTLLPAHVNPSYADEEIARWEQAARAKATTVQVEFARESAIITLS